jgi:hypothetical protein
MDYEMQRNIAMAKDMTDYVTLSYDEIEVGPENGIDVCGCDCHYIIYRRIVTRGPNCPCFIASCHEIKLSKCICSCCNPRSSLKNANIYTCKRECFDHGSVEDIDYHHWPYESLEAVDAYFGKDEVIVECVPYMIMPLKCLLSL